LSKLYFIQAGENGPIKIGYAAVPSERLRDLQVGNAQPLRLLHEEDFGDHAPRQEALWHQTFKEARIRGEWFGPWAPLVLSIYLLKRGISFCASPDGELTFDSTADADVARAWSAQMTSGKTNAGQEIAALWGPRQ